MTKRSNSPGRSGALVIIGGSEDKTGERIILSEVARRVQDGKLTLATMATREPEEALQAYRDVFAQLGIKTVSGLHIHERSDAFDEQVLEGLRQSKGIFFTGGDQLRITSLIGDTPVEHEILRIHNAGGLIAGTSAGATVLGGTMLFGRMGFDAQRVGGLQTAPGLGILKNVIIDQHFAERGRIRRLVVAVAQNPRMLGLGIDEDTAIVVEDGAFRVLGQGAVYVIDGTGMTHSSMVETEPEKTISLHDIRLHVLTSGERFDLDRRRPLLAGHDGSG